jgi:hypothetical protein
MRKSIVLLLVPLAFLAVVAPAGPAFAKQGSLAGYWYSIDTDGSNQVLSLVGSGRSTYSVLLSDDAATVCVGDPAIYVGPGAVEGATMTTDGAVVCLPGGNPLHFRVSLTFTYDSGSNTLTDNSGVVWHR